MTDPAQPEARRDERRRGARPGPAPGGMSGAHLRVAILPATAIAVLGAATVAFVLVGGHSVTATRIALVAAAALAALVLIAAVTGAASATRRLQLQVTELRRASSRAQDELALLTERAQRGEQPMLAGPAGPEVSEPFEPAADSDGLAELAGDLERERHAARQAVVQAAAQGAGGRAAPGERAAGRDERVEVFVNLARRMQSLVHQEILLLDDLEAQVEDPALLKGLFNVDHLATRMRRQAESLAVLGGAVSRRQWSRPVTVHEVLRAAVAEVEQYTRVTVVPPVEGTLPGSAVADVIHLVAELIENATRFSAPHTQVSVRAELVTTGLVVEVEDRGLGMRAADQQRLNALLADPTRVNTAELLRDGRIGLFVVATLARRHGIRVQLQGNIYGGVQAVIVLPRILIESAPPRPAEPAQAGPDVAEPIPPAPRESAPAGTLPTRSRSAAESTAAESTAAESTTADSTAAESTAAESTAEEPATGEPAASEPAPAELAFRPPARRKPPAPRAPSARRKPPAPPAPDATPAPAALKARPTPGMPPEPPVPDTPSAPDAADAAGEAPPELPRRAGQTHMAPELREARARRRDQPADDQLPGLMASFQRGISRAAEEDHPAETDRPR
ncbi:MAG TPA: ATP-binding protein [Streptosporangiaceae bacterium]|nr:ATP-binding protein [Streptosporangiaceae bacterium]